MNTTCFAPVRRTISKALLPVALLSATAVVAGMNGCATTGSSGPRYNYTHRVDPHAGRENETAMRAIGAVIRPHSKLGPAETEQRIQGLGALGTLLDLGRR